MKQKSQIAAILLTVLITGGIAFFILIPVVWSFCSCAGFSSIDEAFEESDAVFLGIAGGKEAYGPEGLRVIRATSQQTLFDVSHVWKGNVTSTVTVFGGTCGFTFRHGNEYLVFAYEEDVLTPNICTGNAQMSYNEAEKLLKREPIRNYTQTDVGWVLGRYILLGFAALAILSSAATTAYVIRLAVKRSS